MRLVAVVKVLYTTPLCRSRPVPLYIMSSFPRLRSMLLVVLLLSWAGLAQAQEAYVPPYGPEWATRSATEAGFDAERLAAAVERARAAASDLPVDLDLYIAQAFAGEPHNEIIGPTKERGPTTGIILRDGYLVAEWGEPHRVDMTFSVTKSFLSATAGVAVDRGLIRDVQDPVRRYVPDGGYTSEQNRSITWHQLLNQTSAWAGTLFGKPDWADRPTGERGRYHERELPAPGTQWEYNDVRVNQLALSLLRVFREPLPSVLRRAVMDRIGASRTWQWHGYENAWVRVDGQHMQSVSGGGHWGGGMFISARDLARFGLLTLRRGRWGDTQVLSEAWVAQSLTPTAQRPTYGYMNWFLNTDQQLLPSAPAAAFYHAGAGANIVYVDPVHDLVVVLRWIDNRQLDDIIAAVLEAMQ